MPLMAPSSVLLYALCLLFFVSAEGRRLLQTTNTTSTTNYNDATGLKALIDKYPRLSGSFPSYTNDPCYPVALSWIKCNNDYPLRRVTALYLDYRSLYGILPDFSDMDALERIELQGNYLSGSIPDFLGYFPELTYLNLADNSFSGQLPNSLVSNSRLITLNVNGNTGLSCRSGYSYSCSSLPYSPPPFRGSRRDFDSHSPVRKKPKIKIIKKLIKILIVPILFIIFVLLGAICAICSCCFPEKKEPAPDPDPAPDPAPADDTAETAEGASAAAT